jgi:mannose-6-phosphate isomerase-like protein (cupin superfamily)
MGEKLGARELAGVVQHWTARRCEWQPLLRCLDGERWSGLLHVEAAFDVWLLTWPVQTGTQLHDHGDSAGAFEVISGSLEEIYFRRRLRRRSLGAGSRVAFPAGAVHDVRSAGRSDGAHAISIHAYSPPLTSMTYYERLGDGVVSTGSEAVIAPPLLAFQAESPRLVGAAR